MRRRRRPLTDEQREFYAGFVRVPLPVRYVARVAVLRPDRTWVEVEWRYHTTLSDWIEREVLARHPGAIAAKVIDLAPIEPVGRRKRRA